jgi:hypothetical protein
VQEDSNLTLSQIVLKFLTFQMLEFCNHFLHRCFQSHICEWFNSSSSTFKININSGKYLHDISFLQLAVAKKTEVKNLGCATLM